MSLWNPEQAFNMEHQINLDQLEVRKGGLPPLDLNEHSALSLMRAGGGKPPFLTMRLL
jgi:hypothetical protein